MKGISGRIGLTLAGVTLIAGGLATLTYAASTLGAFDRMTMLAAALDRPSPVVRGAQVYQAECFACHGGPNATVTAGFPPRHNANGRTWQLSDCEMTVVIRAGREPSVPAPGALAMPAFADRLSDDDISAVIGFIKTMWTADERAAQERITHERC